LQSVVKENFEFRGTRNGTRVVTRGMGDFQSVKSHFDTNNLPYYSFCPKTQKSMYKVIRHLPHNTHAEDIPDGPVSLGFDVISVKQMTATRRSLPEVSKAINHPLFPCRGPQNPKKYSDYQASATSQSGWRHIALRMVLSSVITGGSSVTSGKTACTFPATCGAEEVTFYS
jgi:hypothetical protein